MATVVAGKRYPEVRRPLFPTGPDIRAVATGCLFTVTDDGCLHQLGIVEDLNFFGAGVIRVFQQQDVVVIAVPVDQMIDAADGPENGVKFPAGHAKPDQIDSLIGDTALLKKALRFFCIETFGCSENLNVQYSTSIRNSPCGGTV